MMDILNAVTLLANYIIVPSLTYGSQLALGALGITLVYAVLRFSNFAHGEMMSFGTMISIFTIWLFQSIEISIHPLPTALLARSVADSERFFVSFSTSFEFCCFVNVVAIFFQVQSNFTIKSK